MSAPKPKVRRVDDHRQDLWCWACGCGQESGYRTFGWDLALTEALEHSRTHTAERIVDELVHRCRSAAADERASHGRRDWGGMDYWMGRKDEALDAIDLIREHLVKEAT